MTPVNSIEIPVRFVEVADGWYSGAGDMLYAVCSTGNLTTGTNCPVTDYKDLNDRDRKWYLTLWRSLSADVYSALRAACDEQCYPGGHEDISVLSEFDEYIDSIVERLEHEYGLEDWDGCNDENI